MLMASRYFPPDVHILSPCTHRLLCRRLHPRGWTRQRSEVEGSSPKVENAMPIAASPRYKIHTTRGWIRSEQATSVRHGSRISPFRPGQALLGEHVAPCQVCRAPTLHIEGVLTLGTIVSGFPHGMFLQSPALQFRRPDSGSCSATSRMDDRSRS